MRAVVALAALPFLAACGHQLQGPVTEPHVAPAVEHLVPMAPQTADLHDPVLQEGRKIFNEVCVACHTLEPPPNLAPPMSMVAMHLRQAFDSRDAAVDHVVTYAPAPDAGRSILPSHAVDRFGLMPPQPLRPDQLEKVAAYVWSLGEGGPMMGGMGMRMRHRAGGA